jgi:hypothetical protein
MAHDEPGAGDTGEASGPSTAAGGDRAASAPGGAGASPASNRRFGAVVFAIAVVAVGAFAMVWWPRSPSAPTTARGPKTGPVVDFLPARDVAGRESTTEPRPSGVMAPVDFSGKAEQDAEAVAERLLRAIDDRDAKGFRAIVRTGASADAGMGAGDADAAARDAALVSQLDYLHVRYGARPHRLHVAVVPRSGGADDGLHPVQILFGDHEDLLTVDVDSSGKVVAFHEDDPSAFVEAPAK